MVLPVLILGIGQLLDLALRLPQTLLGIGHPPVLSIKLRLQLADASVHLAHGLLATLEGLLGLLLRKGGLRCHLIKIARQGLHLRVQLHLAALDGLVGASLVSQGLIGVSKLLLNHPSGTVSLFQESAGLLQSILVSIGLAVSSNEVVMSNLLGSLGILKLGLGLSQTKLVLLDGLLGLSIGSISMLKSSLQVHDISLQLLLHAVSLSLSLGFHLNSSLHALNGLVHVLPGGIKLLILLSHSALNLLPDLGELKLGTEHLVLLLLKSTLSFRESSLKLHLLSLKTLADFVNLMDGAAALADLVHDVLDLIGKALVLPPHFLKLEDTLLIGRLDSEEFRGRIAGGEQEPFQ